jgi:uncharacterized iron-regulated membrane protein
MRALLVIHRYLAVAVGLLMALWCLSGFVMIYQPFPELTDAERVAGLRPFDWTLCCQVQPPPGTEAFPRGSRIEMLGPRMVMRRLGAAPIELGSGLPLARLSRDEVLQVAADYAAGHGITAPTMSVHDVQVDQWSVQSAPRNQPAQRVELGDGAGTELYINAATGEVFQQTQARERMLSWFGAIPHWLYPTILRSNGRLWSQVVIWTSLAGTFLAATGLWVGITRWRWRGSQPASPFKGWWYWHHVAGLVFGFVVLTWVSSGLMTMNPWGLLEGTGVAARLRAQLAGGAQAPDLPRLVRGISSRAGSNEFVQLESASFDGRPFFVASRRDGTTLRVDADGNPAPLTPTAVRHALERSATPVASLGLLAQGDPYYHGDGVELPAVRAVLADTGRTRVYLGIDSARITVVDADGRWSRWIERGLHQMDLPGLQSRPLWDVVVLLLLAGASVSCVSGSWMAVQRMRRDMRRVAPAFRSISSTRRTPRP